MLTRSIINKNIKFIDVGIQNAHGNDQVCNFDNLSTLIDTIKNLLQEKYNCQPGQSVLIGIRPSILQIATFFACSELGLTIVIVDYDRIDKWINPNYVDPKTKSLLPIDYFIDNSANPLPGKNYLFNKICGVTIELTLNKLNNFNKSPNSFLGCKNNSIVLKCTSSGTTGTAKIINHTHEFLYHLIQRNKNFFYGNICMAHNLNHGSSVATYFLPALCSDKTENFVSFMFTEIIENPPKDESITARAVEKFTKSNFHHLMIPYSHMVEKFLNNSDYRALIVYTLSSIKKDWVRFYKNQKIYDIISIFGSNETSGPTFINRISDVNFEETKYKTIDNFYNINLRDGQHLEVGMPIYNTTISTNDTFKLVDGAYYHTGRSDLYRINGQVVDVQYYNKLAADVNATCVIDTFKDSLYLAFWENTDFEKKVSHINSLITIKSRNLHKINKFALLNKNNFLSGIKLDMELLRDYFRKFVD